MNETGIQGSGSGDDGSDKAGSPQAASGGSILLGSLISPIPYVFWTIGLPLYISYHHPIDTVPAVGYSIEIAMALGPAALSGVAAWLIPRHRKTFIGIAMGTVFGFALDVLVIAVTDWLAYELPH